MKLFRYVWINLLVLALVSSCQQKEEKKECRVETLPFYGDASFTPHWFSLDSDSLNGFHQIGGFELVNQQGETVSESTFDQKIYITDFFFTSCPGICPKMTKNMGVLQKEFSNDADILLLSHSVTPEQDSVEALNRYAEIVGVKAEKWHLVTGSRKTIYDLGRNHYFVEEDLGIQKTDEDFLHTENFVLVDKNRHIRGIYSGLNTSSISQLIADVRQLQKES